MAGLGSSPSITTVCIVGDRQLGRFGGLKRLSRAIQTSWIAAVIFIVAAEAWYGLGGNAVAAQSLYGTPRFSIVVLPFANLSGDPTQEPIADAISSKLERLARQECQRHEHATAARLLLLLPGCLPVARESRHAIVRAVVAEGD
jgi:hypothetical protein